MSYLLRFSHLFRIATASSARLLLARNCFDGERSARQLSGLKQPASREAARQSLTQSRH
jgi:hypothetical protein